MRLVVGALIWGPRMSKAEDKVKKIRDEIIGVTSKRVLLVEGPDDVKAFTQLLNRKRPGWELTWAVVEAGNKKTALEMAALAPDWLVLVDRDEWTAAEIETYQTKNANLFVLPRFCLESYLIDPAELWLALPPVQQAKIIDGVAGIENALFANLAAWKRHAALWQVINPLWSGLRALGFKDALLRTTSIPDDNALERTLTKWSELMDVKRILDEVHATIANMNAQPMTSFLHGSLYAKNFYPQVVHPALDRLLGQKPAEARRISLFKTLPMPEDLDPLWARM